jgi:hypothetical protein
VVDSETRWRLVRRLKQKPSQAEGEVLVRAALASDLPLLYPKHGDHFR